MVLHFSTAVNTGPRRPRFRHRSSFEKKSGLVYKNAMSQFTDNHGCFVCGERNPSGLKLRFSTAPETHETESSVIFPEMLQGWEGTVHGGLITTVLDEMLVQAAAAQGYKCITAEISVKFKKPVAIGRPYRIVGKVGGVRGRIVIAESGLFSLEGEAVAEAHGKLLRV